MHKEYSRSLCNQEWVMMAHVPIRKSRTGKLDYRGHEIRKFVFPICHHAEPRTCLLPKAFAVKRISSSGNF